MDTHRRYVSDSQQRLPQHAGAQPQRQPSAGSVYGGVSPPPTAVYGNMSGNGSAPRLPRTPSEELVRPHSRPRPPRIDLARTLDPNSAHLGPHSPHTPTQRISENLPYPVERSSHIFPSPNPVNGRSNSPATPGSVAYESPVQAKYAQQAYPVENSSFVQHVPSYSSGTGVGQRQTLPLPLGGAPVSVIPHSANNRAGKGWAQVPPHVREQIQSQARKQIGEEGLQFAAESPLRHGEQFDSQGSFESPPSAHEQESYADQQSSRQAAYALDHLSLSESNSAHSDSRHRRHDSSGSGFTSLGEPKPTPRRQYQPHEHTSASASKTGSSVITIDQFELTRRRAAQQPHNPQVQFDYAKQLIEASARLAGRYSDPITPTTITVDHRVEVRNRETWTGDAQRIVRKLASTANFPDAIFLLASSYSSGSLGLEANTSKAFELYMRGAKLDHPESCYRVAVCYELGVGVRKETDKALSWYKRAAQLGDVSSMYKLGMMSLYGTMDQPRNIGEGLMWLQRAADKADANTPHAVHELGRLYEHAEDILGRDSSAVNADGQTTLIVKNEAKALELFYRAANFGYAPSQFRLGRAHEFGELGCEVGPAKSISWYTAGAQNGDPDSELGLAGWYWTGADGVVRQSDTEAFVWAEKAANRRHARAEFALGYFYQTGVGVAVDLEKARAWYLRAYEKKHPKAAARLRELDQL